MFRPARPIVCVLLLACPALLIAQEAKKGKDFKGKDLEKRDLRNTPNLEHANFDDAKMFLVNLKEVNAKGASFRDADLTSASLDGADLSGADFREATLDFASFQKSNLQKANFSGTDLGKTSLQGADLRGADLRGIKGLSDVTKADFRDADLRGANMLGGKDYGGSTAMFKGAKYDKNTRWYKGFDVESSGAVLVETKEAPAVAVKTPKPVNKTEPADKEPAPTQPKGAPPVAEVKSLLQKRLWDPAEGDKTKHTYNYKTLKFADPRKGDPKMDGVPAGKETIVFPVRAVVEITRTFPDGTSRKEEKKQSYVFFKDEFGDWTFRFLSND